MHKVLITKSLTNKQRAIAHDYQLEVDEVPFIKTTYNYECPIVKPAQAWVVSSIHAAKFIATHYDEFDYFPEVIYAIGASTASHLDHLQIKIKTPSYASALRLVQLIEKDSIQSAIFFCGNLRKDSIPNALRELDYQEIQVYKTDFLTPKINMNNYKGVAFFSPSGVQAFSKFNTIKDQVVVAIGTTTKQAVQEFLDTKARIPAAATVEDVLFALKQDVNSKL